MQIHVKGGTRAGTRIIRDPGEWVCKCPIVQPGHRYSCGQCGTRRWGL